MLFVIKTIITFTFCKCNWRKPLGNFCYQINYMENIKWLR